MVCIIKDLYNINFIYSDYTAFLNDYQSGLNQK